MHEGRHSSKLQLGAAARSLFCCAAAYFCATLLSGAVLSESLPSAALDPLCFPLEG